MANTNPTVSFGAFITSSQIQGLLIAIREITGKLFGFHPTVMHDTQFSGVILTLNKDKKLSKTNKKIVEATIRAWSIGFGLGNPFITWPENY